MSLNRVCSGDGLVDMANPGSSGGGGVKAKRVVGSSDASRAAAPPSAGLDKGAQQHGADKCCAPPSSVAPNQMTRTTQVFWSAALNSGPTLSVLLIIGTVFGIASLFLETYVVTSQASTVVFFVGSYVIFSSYFMFDHYLNKFSSSYAKIDDHDNKFYVISNLIKSAVLLAYTPLAAKLLWQTIYLDVWNTVAIRNLGCMYAIPDFVSLLLVKKMSRATIAHHVCVCVFNLYSMYNDYEQQNICRLMVVYAIFSTFAYLVNLLLASRYLNFSPLASALLSAGAALIYIVCCAINWAWQVYYTHALVLCCNHYSIYIYVALILMVVYDDLVLIKWLLFNVSRKVKQIGTATKKA